MGDPQRRPPMPLLVTAIALLGAAGCGEDESYASGIIPLPQQVDIGAGYLELDADARIVASSGAEAVGALLATSLRTATGYDLEVSVDDDANAGDIVITLAPDLTALGDEGYRLEVSDRVQISAPGPAGLFYAGQTLRQLLPGEIERSTVSSGVTWRIPRLFIEDYPRYPWRGVMLDVARHFFPVAVTLRYIDLAASYKLNVVHLHLTDDQGWRIAIDSWPRLTEVGASTQVGGGAGGYYSKADYAAIVAYASARFVTIVPEIDMPGHCNAALASYGELNESGLPAELYTGTEVGFSSMWIDGEITYTFIGDVIAEVAAMTPGDYIHIGGDEAAATSDSDYVAFITAIQDIVVGQGKRMIGWEEIGAAELAPPFLAQFWLTEREARAAVAAGGQIIASPAIHAYLDMRYDAWTEPGTNWAGFTDLDKAYDWDPVMGGLAADDVVGVEAALWTENVATSAEVDLMSFPRLIGHAEIAWSAATGRSWEDYRERLARHAPHLDARGVGYYRSPIVDWPTR